MSAEVGSPLGNLMGQSASGPSKADGHSGRSNLHMQPAESILSATAIR